MNLDILNAKLPGVFPRSMIKTPVLVLGKALLGGDIFCLLRNLKYITYTSRDQ